jgi:hypothetical protein
MSGVRQRVGTLLVVGLTAGVAGVTAPPARAQTVQQQARRNRAAANPVFSPANVAAARVATGRPAAAGRGYAGRPAYYGAPGFYPAYGTYVQNPTEGVLNGAAEYMRGEADYYQGIQQAKIGREQARQAAIDTRRKLAQEEAEYEKNRPTALTMRDRERAADLDWARKDPPNTEIWAGRSLNVLLRSCLASGRLDQGPNIPLDEFTLQGLNLTDKTSRANAGLLKKRRLYWPDTLQEDAFAGPRKAMDKLMAEAAEHVNKYKEPVDRPLLLQVRKAYDSLDGTLESMVKDLTPSQYIGSRRYLNDLKDCIKAIGDPAVGYYYNPAWVSKMKNVTDLVAYMSGRGLEFAPAVAVGDEPAYSAFYQSLRSFERSLGGGR